MIAWYLRDLAGAEKLLEPLHRDAPGDPVSANLLALALIEQEDAAKQSRGLQLAEVNAIQFPRSHDATTTLGWALYRAGRVDEAEQKLRSAIAGGMTPDVAYFLARVLADKGKTDDARGLLQRATSRPRCVRPSRRRGALLKTLTK